MAITNIDTPEKVSLSRSPIEVAITSNLPGDQFPINRLRLTITDTFNEDEYINIIYGDVNERFTVKVTADDTGNTLSERGSLTLAQYGTLLAQEFNKNYELFTTFDIYFEQQGSSYFIKFDPRTDRALSWSFGNNLSNVTVENIQAESPEYNTSQAVLLLVQPYNNELQQYTDDFLTHVLPHFNYVDPIVFDISADFDLAPALPDRSSIGVGGDYFQSALRNWTKYKLWWTEQYGHPAVRKALQTDGEEYFALFGGNDFFNQYQNFWAFHKDNGKFLTAAPRSQTITYEQPVFLYWLGRIAKRYITIGGRYTQRSGATTPFTRGANVEELGHVFIVKAGFEQLGLPDTPTNPIVSYEVWLESNGNPISETFTFSITGDCHEFTRYFLFANSQGGCDTLRTTGKHVINMETDTQVATRIVDSEVVGDGYGEDFHYDRKSRIVYEGRTGYKSRNYIAYLQDFINSPAVWLIDMQNQRFTPVLVSPGRTQLLKDDEDLYALQFEYTHAWDESHLGITDDGQRIILSDTGEDFQPDPE
jgi:hypothetical protein